MFQFINDKKENGKEIVKISNKIIIDEMDFINKMCFVYSMLKVENKDMFKENLEVLLSCLVKLKNLRNSLEKELSFVKEEYEIESLESIYSLSSLRMYADLLIEEDVDDTINNIVEVAEVNGISMDEKFHVLAQYLNDEDYEEFSNEMYEINKVVNGYISRSISTSNKKTI